MDGAATLVTVQSVRVCAYTHTLVLHASLVRRLAYIPHPCLLHSRLLFPAEG